MVTITGSRRTEPAQGRAVRRSGTAGGSTFHVAQESGAADAAAAACPVAMPSLLALQEEQSTELTDREARRHGAAVMDELSGLQRALLGGTQPACLARLASLAGRTPAAADPRLAGVLRAIQLRAQIELARHGAAASG